MSNILPPYDRAGTPRGLNKRLADAGSARPRGSARQSRSQRGRIRLGLAAVVLTVGAGLAPAVAQESIDDARTQRAQTRVDELRAQAALDVLDAEFEDITASLAAADDLVALSQARIEAVEAQLELAEGRLARTEVGIAWANYDRSQVDQELADLALEQYLSTGRRSSVWQGADLNEAMTRNAVLDVVQGAGRDLIDTARSAAEQNQDLQTKAEGEIADIERLRADLELEKETLTSARQIRAKAQDALEGRRTEWTAIAEELEAEREELTEFIRVETLREQSQSALDAEASRNGYVWPTEGRIGSYFGYRTHPILGYSRLHGGLDIGGPMGQAIWAAKSGTVILAGVKGGYGNTIVIDHGDGYATLYGHQSSFEVSVGDVVETGEHIGNVGSTGMSTGPHLHFEVRIDGEVTDPLPYLPER